jgi:CRP/FNR family cyclic AMP-dependent transcriptional regulator
LPSSCAADCESTSTCSAGRTRFLECFIGSTVEALPIAREIQAALGHDPFVGTVWTDSVFGASAVTIESLEKALEESDFACLVVTGDDVIRSRDHERNVPRDNVVFELGLFMGRLGRDRVFMVRPRGEDIKIPTALHGISMLDYARGDERDLAARLGPACTALRKLVNKLGPR